MNDKLATVWWALRQELPVKPKMVLIMLANYMSDEKGYAWPTYKELARLCGMPESTCRKHVQWLVDRGLLKKEKHIYAGRQRSNRYYIPVNVMAFQGAHNEQAGCSKLAGEGAHNEQPKDTLKTDTPTDTPIDAGASQEADMKFKKGGTIAENLATTDSEMWGMGREEALAKVRSGINPDGTIKWSALERLWKFARGSASNTNYGTYVTLTKKEKGQLMHAWDRVGEDLLEIVWNVMSDWAGFCRAAERDEGAFNSPTKPNVVYFTKYLTSAVDFTAAEVGADDGWTDL